MRRAVLVTLLVVTSFALAGTTAGWLVGDADAAGATGSIAVANVTVSPTTPTAGDTVTLTVTLENPQGSGRTVDVGAVSLRNAAGEGLTEYARAEGIGRLQPGSRTEVPLYRTFDEPGSHRMRVVVYPNDGQPIQYPVLVEVGESSDDDPSMDVSAERTVAGARTQLNVTVVNDRPTDIFGATLTLDGNLSVEDGRRVFGELTTGDRRTATFEVTPSQAGSMTAVATIRYTTDEGTETATRRLDLDVAEPNPSLALDARSATQNGSTVVEVTLTNDGNVPLRDLSLRASSPAVSLSETLTDPVEPGSRRTVSVDVGSVNGTGEVTVPLVASYAAAGRSMTTESDVVIAANPGAIRLTGVRVQRQRGKLHLSGSTSNVGLSKANSVLVSVVDTANVTPANPNRDYFVGEVPANEFVTFDVYARVSGPVSSIPLQVEYIVAGQRHSRVVEVPVATGPPAGASPGSGQGGQQDGPEPRRNRGPGVGAIAFGGVVTLAVGGVVLRGWRRSRGGD